MEVNDGSEARSSKDGAKMLPEAANQVTKSPDRRDYVVYILVAL